MTTGFPVGPNVGHDLMDILPKALCIKMRDDHREDFRGAILDSPDDTEQHAAGDPAPGAIESPDVALEGLFRFDVTRTQGTGGQASALGGAPPAGPGQGQTPEHHFVGIEQEECAPARLVLEGSEVN